MQYDFPSITIGPPSPLGQNELFYNLPATDLEANNASLYTIEKKLNLLTDESSVLDCCVMSYKLAPGTIRYQLFGTTVL